MTIELRSVKGEKVCYKESKRCMNNGDQKTCLGCAVYTGNGKLPVLFQGN